MEVEIKYAGYIKKQEELVERFQRMEKVRIPQDMGYDDIPGLSREIKEKLSTIRPMTLGQQSLEVVIGEEEISRAFCFSTNSLGNGIYEDIADIVFKAVPNVPYP